MGDNLSSVDNRQIGKYFTFGIIILLLFLSYKIISNYILVLISAFLVAYIVKPLYDRLSKYIGKVFSAWICLVSILLILIIPIATIVSQLYGQVYSLLTSSDISLVISKISSLGVIQNLGLNVDSLFDKLISFGLSIVGKLITQIPNFAIYSIIFTFAFIYILLDWDSLMLNLKKIIPYKNKQKIMSDIDSYTRSIIYGSMIIATLEFIISSIGFYFAGSKIYLLLALILAILSFIPSIGPSFVMVPMSLLYVYNKNWISLSIVIVVWIVLTLFVETILKAKILSNKTNLHPVIMIVGIMGGIPVFGIIGLIIGPLILIYTIRILQSALGDS